MLLSTNVSRVSVCGIFFIFNFEQGDTEKYDNKQSEGTNMDFVLKLNNKQLFEENISREQVSSEIFFSRKVV